MTPQSLFVKALKHPDSRDEAFALLVSEYKERLYWHIRKIVIDHDDANDVVQNTFIKVHINIENFKEKKIVVASNLIDAITKACEIKDYKVLKTFKGKDFLGTICSHPFTKMNFTR